MSRTSKVVEVAPGIRAVVRDWLHSNTVVLPGPSPAIIDTGYVSGVDALIGRIEEVGFAIEALEDIYLTHVHSDHAGGCAALQRRCGARIWAHEQCRALVDAWDARRLWLDGLGQTMPRFRIDATLVPGRCVAINGIEWQVVETLGHAVGGVSLYAPGPRVLVSGDALWYDGFGVLNIHLEGEAIIDLAERALDNLSALDVDVVIPGHGAPFGGYREALARARRRLAGYRHDRAGTLRRNLRSMLAFWLLANAGAPRQDLDAMIRKLVTADKLLGVAGQGVDETVARVVSSLAASSILREEGGRVYPGERLE